MSKIQVILQAIGEAGKNLDGSYTRACYSPEYKQAVAIVRQQMENLGMTVQEDAAGNIHGVLPGTDKAAKSIDTETTDADTTTTQKGQSFDNVELQTILDNISSYYKLNVVYNSDKSKHLRLHFYWDKSKDAETIVESLNHFENVNITLTDNKIDVK